MYVKPFNTCQRFKNYKRRHGNLPMVGFQPWTCWSLLWTGIYLVCLSIPKMSLFWQHKIVLYFKCGARFKSGIHHCVQCSKTVVGFQPWTCWSFLWTYLALGGIYILRIFLFLHQRSVLYLDFGIRFKSGMHHCVQFSKKNRCGVSTLNRIMISMNWSSSSWYIFTKNVSYLTTDERARF